MKKQLIIKKQFIATALIAGFTLASLSQTALADSSRRFKSTINTSAVNTSAINTPIRAVRINVVLSDDLIYRANHLSKNLRHRPHNYRDGFEGHGFYGERDLNHLAEHLKTKLGKQLSKHGIAISDDADAVLNVILKNVQPTRPTFYQRTKFPSLSYESYGLGGAGFEANLVVDGKDSGSTTYAWFATDLYDAQFSGTWSDTRRAISHFARKTAQSLKHD
ncbi:MAG: hypothetical protein V3U57_04755 [Robiginitomaculum sp.]